VGSPLDPYIDIADEIVPDFRTIKNSGEASFDISAYNSPETTKRLHDSVRALSRFSAQAKPTQLHYFLDRLAQSGRLLRHFTQNVDCIERQLSHLWEKTVQLHGRIDQVKCQLCSWNGALLPQWFCGPDLHDCPRCEQVAIHREKVDKRRRSLGRLRPNVVLYGEEDPDGDAIGRITERDLRTGPDVVLVVGTGLKVPGARRLVKELCRAAKHRNGFTIWASKDAPPRGLAIAFDAVFRCDCDDLAALL
jgi:NAD-dependent histone deacetylase SIR2